jgi:hypothetical protein
MINYGQSTQNTQRIEERPAREIARQQIWIPEACPSDGVPPREESRKHSRLVKVENASKLNGPFSIRAETTEELETFFKEKCGWNSHCIGLLFSSSQPGACNRKYFQGKIDPSIDTVYVKLYLKKHPSLPRDIA